MRILLLCSLCLLNALTGAAYTRQDTLRGSNGRGRDWWDVVRYDLTVNIDTLHKSIDGHLVMGFRIIAPPRDSMQIDLREGMELAPFGAIDGFHGDHPKEGNVRWIIRDHRAWGNYSDSQIFNYRFDFHGKPRIAANPPWDGGFIWTKDSTDKPWIAVACQGLGASSWWPCKDYQGDEPDNGMNVELLQPEGLLTISNGRIIRVTTSVDDYWTKNDSTYSTSKRKTTYEVHNPINTYNATFYIGDYAHWHDTLHGEGGILDLDFYPLKYNEAKARKQWTQAKEMLRCFEYWMGPYPFYEDGYKLVEAPYLGMEHQSAIAYGNDYQNGYNGRGLHIDRSGTGVGFAFDFIIIHESGHEWFGNSITARDIADNWLHEGFTTYTEELFAEWIRGRDSGFAYTTGEWKNIRNDKPVIGDYGVNDDGSGDKYDKGSAVVHMIRMMINDDKRFRELLRGLNRDFYHKIVSSKEVEDYISMFVGKDLNPFFEQYLRRKELPVLKAAFFGKKNIRNKILSVGVKESVPGFTLPVFSKNGQYLFTLSESPIDLPEQVFQEGIKNYLVGFSKD